VIDDEVHRHPEEALLSELSVVVANEDKKEAAASRSKARYGELSARPLLRGWIVTAGLFKVWMTRSPTVHASAGSIAIISEVGTCQSRQPSWSFGNSRPVTDNPVYLEESA